MHTEKEMRDIRCCGPEGCGDPRFVGSTVTSADGITHVTNTGPPGGPGPNMRRFCIASKCAAWEWKDDNEIRRRGYCGLKRHSGTS